MISDLLAALGNLDEPPTAQELAEALWLAESLPAGLTAPMTTLPSPLPSLAEPPASGADWPESATGAVEGEVTGRDPGQATVRMRAPYDQAAERIAGVSVRMPAVPTLTGTQTMARALRPLRRRFPSEARSVLDEAATAAAIADDGLWSPRYRPAMDRWLGLTLVVDESTSMVVWRQPVSEFRTLLERLGAFRDLRTWRFDGDQSAAEFQSPDGSVRRPRELIDPTGRRLILVVSDCIGAVWKSGTVARALEEWSRTSPVAVLQPLPERMWAHCGVMFTPVTFQASRPGLATRSVIVQPRAAARFQDLTGRAIPVLEMDPEARWLSFWAALIAGHGRVPGVAVYTGGMTRQDGPAWLPGDPAAKMLAQSGQQLTGLQRVQRFRSKASPAAYQLAGYLAAAPLSLPVMRLVQNAMLPRSQPAHLAEVLLSDLLVRCSGDGGTGRDVSYEFHDDVRGELLAGLPRSDTLRVIEEVSRFLGSRMESPWGFPAILDAGADGILSVGMPFARVMHTALRALGGHYAEIADKLEPRLENGGLPTSPAAATIAPSASAEPARGGTAGDADQEQHPPPAPPSTRPEHQPGDREHQPVDREQHPGDNVTQPTPVPQLPRERRTGLPAGWETVPLRNPNFTGREELLLELHNQLGTTVTALVPQALHGLGGVGKTQLAVEYAYRFRAEYDLVWWIPAEHREQIISRLVELAALMGLPISENSERTARTVLSALRQGSVYQRWLLIYDNAGPPEEIVDYLPHAAGDILITSLSQDWLEAANTIQVNVFDRHESVDLILRRGRGITKEDANRLADRLGDLPLAVEQAATWQRQTGMAVSEYLELLDNQQQRLLSEARTIGHPMPVVEAWGVAFDRLAEEDPPAAELLQLCAFFGPEPIFTQILHAGRHVVEALPLLRATVQDTIMLHQAIRKIGRYGLAWVEAEESLRIHRLVQAVLRDRVPEERQAHYQRLVHLFLAEANPGDPDESANWPMLARISEHIVRSTGLIEGEGAEVRQVIVDQIRYRYVRGDYESSRELADRAVGIWRDKYGDNDEFTLVASYHLGNAMRQLGRYREALEINQETRERMIAVLEPGHEHILRLTSSYGADLRFNGNYDQALALDQENLDLYIAKFGDDDRNTLRCENNLAVDLRMKGAFRQALIRDEKILRMRTEKFGPADQDTLFAQCMLARDLRGCGEYRAALALHQEVLPEFRELLGDSHQDVLNARLSYGITLYRMGLYTPARAEIDACLAAFSRRFGSAHPGSVMAMTILASPLRLLGHRGEAQNLAGKALEKAIRLFGKDHVFAALYANNFAITGRSIGQFDVALASDKQTLPKIQKVLGERHPFALSSTANLANSWHGVDDFAAARAHSQRAWELSTSVRGEHNPLTLLCACNLAVDMKAVGEEDAGVQLQAQAVGEFSGIMGSESTLVKNLYAGQRYEFDIQPPQV